MSGHDYINNVYKALKSDVKGFDKTEMEFRNLIMSDDSYRTNVYNALKSDIQGFNKTMDEFNNSLGTLKKKEETFYQVPLEESQQPSGSVSSLEGSLLDSNIPQGTDPTQQSLTENVIPTTAQPGEVDGIDFLAPEQSTVPLDAIKKPDPLDPMGYAESVNKQMQDQMARIDQEKKQRDTDMVESLKGSEIDVEKKIAFSDEDLERAGLRQASDKTSLKINDIGIKEEPTPIEEQSQYIQQYLPLLLKEKVTSDKILDEQKRETREEAEEFNRLVEEAEGSVPMAYWNMFVDGYSNTVSATTENAMRMMEYFFPKFGMEVSALPMTAEEKEDYFSEFSGQIKGILDDQLKDKETNEQMIELLKKKSFLHEGGLGVMGSGYAMMTPGMSGFFMTGMNDGYHDIREANPEVTPEQAMLYGTAQGIVAMALEKVGFNRIVKGGPLKNLIKQATVDVMSKAPAEVAKNGVKIGAKKLNDLAVEVANGYLAEFQTGTLQYLGEEAIKQLSDQVLNQDNFENIDSENIGEFMKGAFLAGHKEASGGFIMGGIKGAKDAILSPSRKSKVKDKVEKIEELRQELKNENVSDETKDIISDNIKEMSGEVLQEVSEDFEDIKNLNDEERREVENIASSISEKEKILNDENVSENVKNVISDQIEELSKKSDEIIESSKKNIGEQAEIQFPEESTKEKEAETIDAAKDVVTPEDQPRDLAPPGKRLFNDPNPETAEISKKYKEEKGLDLDPGEKITELDEDRAMKIADAYEQMEDSPNDPEVQEAYNAMADETMDQYKSMKDAGYEIEIYEGEGEPYANSEEMIKDLKDNKHMYIFGTEGGFGEGEITDEMRQQNKMLQDSGEVDKNGKKLLINDIFRGIHDFFGHSERGNSFGAKGEENAWDVHARMFSDKARRAMTTETRGQNSWVNFGPQMRKEDGTLIKKGEEGYLEPKDRAFADQKMGLLPEEFSQIDATKSKEEVDVDVVSVHNKEGGSSISSTGENLAGTEGYAVSTRPDLTKIVEGKEITQEDIDSFKEENKELLSDENNFIGTWYNKDDNKTYIDIVSKRDNLEEAEKLAKDSNQIAIYDLKNQEEIEIGGDGKAVVPEKKEGKEVDDKKKPKTVTDRFIKSSKLTKEEADKITEMSQKEPTTNKERIQKAEDLISEFGLDRAYEITQDKNSSKSIDEETRNYVSVAKANQLSKQAADPNISKEERFRLLDKAAEIMMEPARQAERGGQISQFWDAIYNKFPEMRTKTNVAEETRKKINEALNSVSDNPDMTVSEQIEAIRESIKKEIREEIAEEVKNLKEKIKKLERAKSGKERIAKGRKQVSEAKSDIAKILKGQSGTLGMAVVPGLSPDLVKAIAKLLEGYVNIGVGTAKEMLKNTKKDLKDLGVDISDEDLSKIAEENEGYKEALKEDLSRGAISDKDLKDMLEDFFINGNSTTPVLAEYISKTLDLSASDAKKIAEDISSSIENRVKEIAEKELEKNLKINEPLSEADKIEKKKKDKENRKTINKVAKSVMLGSLSGSDFRNSFAEKYGFTEVTPDQMAELETLINEAKRFEKSGQRELYQKTQRRINTELRKMKPKDANFYSQLITELAYVNALSGLNTQGNANVGAISTSTFNFLGKAIEELFKLNPGSLYFGIRATTKSLKAASAAAKEARRFNYSKFTNHNAYLEGATDNEIGIIENEVMKGFSRYFRSVSKFKTLPENAKEIARGVGNMLLQYSRMNFLLNASDAFLTTQFSELNNAIELYNKETEGLGLKSPMSKLINNRSLIKTLDEKMGYSKKPAIEKIVDAEILAEENKIKAEVDKLNLSEKEAKREIKRRKDLTISKGYKSRRVQELMVQSRDQEIYQDAVNTARDWILLNDPDGIFGMANESFKKFLNLDNKRTTAGKIWANFLGLNIMFTRMTAMTANAVMSSIPVLGVLPSVLGYSKNKAGDWTFGFKYKHDPLLVKRRLMANGLMTLAGSLAFMHMFDYDEEEDEYRLNNDRLIDITVGGYGGTNSVKNQQTLKNYSGYGLAVAFRNSPDEEFGSYRSIKYLPQALPAFAVVGNFSDRVRGLGSDKQLKRFEEKEGVWKLINGASTSIAISQMLEGSFNSIGRATKKISMSDSENFLDGLGMATFDLVTQPAKTVTQPNFYRDLINESGARGEYKKQYPKDLFDRLEYDYYGLDAEKENKTDIFGNKYKMQDKFSQWMEGEMNENYNNKEWKILLKYPEVTLTPYRAPEDINYKGKTYKIEDESVSEFILQKQKQEMKKLVLEKYGMLNSYDSDKLQRKLTGIRNKSIDIAKKEALKKWKYDKSKIKLESK